MASQTQIADFRTKYLPWAAKASRSTGLNQWTILSQWANETNYGTQFARPNNIGNIGVYPGGPNPAYASVGAGVKAYESFITSSTAPGMAALRATRGQSIAEQFRALGNSAYAGSHYNSGGGPGSALAGVLAALNPTVSPGAASSPPGAGVQLPTTIRLAGPAVVSWFEHLTAAQQRAASDLSLPKGSHVLSVKWPGLRSTTAEITYLTAAGKKVTTEFLTVPPGSVNLKGAKNPLWGPTPTQTTGAAHKAAKTAGNIAGAVGALVSFLTEFAGGLTLERVGMALLAFAMVAGGLLLLVTGSQSKSLGRSLQPADAAASGAQSAAAALAD